MPKLIFILFRVTLAIAVTVLSGTIVILSDTITGLSCLITVPRPGTLF